MDTEKKRVMEERLKFNHWRVECDYPLKIREVHPKAMSLGLYVSGSTARRLLDMIRRSVTEAEGAVSVLIELDDDNFDVEL